MARNRYSAGKKEEAEKLLDLAQEYWKKRIEEMPDDDCADVLRVFAFRTELAFGTASEDQYAEELVAESWNYLNRIYNRRSEELAEDFISLSKKSEKHRNEFICFAAAFAEPEQLENQVLVKASDVSGKLAEKLKKSSSLPFSDKLKKAASGLQNMFSGLSKGYFYDSLASLLIENKLNSNYSYYADLLFAEYFLKKEETDKAAAFFEKAANDGKAAFGLPDFRTAYCMARCDEITKSRRYAYRINYRVLAERDFAHSYSGYLRYESWFSYINKYIETDRKSEANSMLSEAKHRIFLSRGEPSLTGDYKGGLEMLEKYYYEQKDFGQAVSFALERLEAAHGSDSYELESVCKRALFLCENSGKEYITEERIFLFMDNEFQCDDSERRFELAAAFADIFNKNGDTGHETAWLLKAEKCFETVNCDKNHEEMIRVCDRLVKIYESAGDIERVREQKAVKQRFNTDGLYV